MKKENPEAPGGLRRSKSGSDHTYRLKIESPRKRRRSKRK